MNTDFANKVRHRILLLLLLSAPVSVVAGQQQVNKELDERLLYVISQREAPPVELVQQLIDQGARVNQPVRYKTVDACSE